jgi:hypothetical protein
MSTVSRYSDLTIHLLNAGPGLSIAIALPVRVYGLCRHRGEADGVPDPLQAR